MLYSYSWLKEFVPEIPSPQTLQAELTTHSVEVEGIESSHPLLADIILAEIISVEKHPNADRLRICVVFDGEKEFQVVCGGSNVEQGMRIAFAPIEAKVQWHGEGEPIVLSEAMIRGVQSFGMICASEEIGLGDLFPSKGEREILDVSHCAQALGTPLAECLGLQDVLLDIDNKSMTHRSDLFSHAGMAQEIAAVFNKKTSFPMLHRIPAKEATIAISIENQEDCVRYMAVEMSVNNGLQTPDFITSRLTQCGVQPRSVVVDIANYVMLEYGQPLHAFDARTISQNSITVRRAKKGEEVALLNGTKKELTEDVLVIADNQKVLACAGVMGGSETAVQDDTSRIVLEIALFHPVTVRKGAQHLGVRTESSLRYEKGLPEELVTIGAQRAVALLQEYAEGAVLGLASENGATQEPVVISLPLATVERVTGIAFTASQVKELLHRLQCKVTVAKRFGGVVLHVLPPWFRPDLEIAEDCIEEIVRLYGIDRIPQTPIRGVLEAPASDTETTYAYAVKETLATMGLSEALTYSFYGPEMLKKMGYKADDGEHIEIANPLSEDLRYLRVSVLPRLLEVIAMNQGHEGDIGFFEVGHVYTPSKEARQLGIVMRGEHAVQKVKGIVEELLNTQHIAWKTEHIHATAPCPFWNAYAGKKAIRYDAIATTSKTEATPDIIGTVGVCDSKVLKQFGIHAEVGFALLSLPVLHEHAGHNEVIRIPSPYPTVTLDLSLLMDERTEWKGIDDMIHAHGGELLQSISIIDEYRGSKIPQNKKSLTCRIVLQSGTETLQMRTMELWRESLMADLKKKFGVELREK